MNGKRMCQSYEIIDSRRVGDTEVVLGYSPTEVSPYREAARDAETFSALAGPQRERHLKLMRKRYLQKVQYCSILEVIQYLKTGR